MSKTQELKNFSYFGSSNKGNHRRSNEDRYAYFETVNGTFFIVCDGMGGTKGGKEAAEITIAEIERYVNEDWYEDPFLLMKNIFKYSNNKVFDFFFSKVQKPGTTLAVVLIRNNMVYYGHVGDSRIYYKTGKKLFQLTRDHSYVMNLVDKKIISEEEAETHIRRNEITKAIGIHNEVEPTICNDPLRPADDDNILICSDGLNNELTYDEISAVLFEEIQTEEKVKKLMKNSLDAGGLDNITLQLVSFYNTGRDTDTHFLKHSEQKTNRYKIISLLGFIIISVLILLYVLFFKPFQKNDAPKSDQFFSETSLLISYADTKDSIHKVFLYDDHTLSDELRRYKLYFTEIKNIKQINGKKKILSFYIPVRKVYNYRACKHLYSFPEINKNNIIDVIVVNNKNDLFFKPGEKIIIPTDNGK